MGYLRAGPSQVPFVKAFTGAVSLALLGVLAIGVSGASAQAGTVPNGQDDAYFHDPVAGSVGGAEVVCVVQGAAGVAASPVDGPEHDAADDDEAADPGNLNDTDGGVFDFATPPDGAVVCAGEDGGGEVIGAFAAADLAIFAGVAPASRLGEGEYTNLILGTGHAEGSADVCGPGAPLCGGGAGNETDLVARFSIDFVDGTGPLAITSFDGVVDLTAPVVPDDDPLDGDAPLPLTPCPAPAPPPPGPGNQEDLDDVADCVDHLQDIDTGHGVGAVEITPDDLLDPPPPTGNADCNPDPGGGYQTPPCNPSAPTPPPCPPGAVDGDCGGPDDVGGFIVEAAFTATLSGDTDIGNNENDDTSDVPNAPFDP